MNREKLYKFFKGKFAFDFSCIAVTCLLLLSVLAAALPSILIEPAYGARFTLLVEEEVYTPGETMVIYGGGAENDLILVTLYDAAGTAVIRDNVVTDSDGFFRQSLYQWKAPSFSVPLGTYTIEAVSSLGTTDTRRVEVTFAEAIVTGQGPRIPTTHSLAIKLDSPDQAAVGEPFRIFTQVTFDGDLVAVEERDTAELLGLSHIHSGNVTITLADKLRRLHEGLYYADVTIDQEGTYIVHSVAFHRGLLAHDSKVISATSSSISTIQESITELDLRLNSTNRELERLQGGIEQTHNALNDTQSAITSSVEEARLSIRSDIETVQQASGQINSLILPVLALISVIIALQISLFARIRASYR